MSSLLIFIYSREKDVSEWKELIIHLYSAYTHSVFSSFICNHKQEMLRLLKAVTLNAASGRIWKF